MPGSPPEGRVRPTPPREGFTTGTAAAAAAGAALDLLLGGSPASRRLVPLPPFRPGGEPSSFLSVPIAGSRLLSADKAEATVIKDGGDDPDVTHGARIRVTVALTAGFAPEDPIENAGSGKDFPDGEPGRARPVFLAGPPPVELRAGPGVGRVTLPGLPVAVGDPAINPSPRRQMEVALSLLAADRGYRGGLKVTISIPDGEKLAKRTLNPRLGIVGGLSVLGTHGTVRPYSHEAWTASIEEGLSVAAATGCGMAVLSTGRRSERLLQGLYPDLPAPAFVQAADFAAFSLEAAARHGFPRLAWGCFFGKLIKLAQGLPRTHAHDAPLDLERLAEWCRKEDLDEARIASLAACATAGQALDIILTHPRAGNILRALALRAKTEAERFAEAAGAKPEITLHLFHLNGKELARV